MVLLISYDLNGHERPSSYQAVRRLIESRARSSWRPLYSQWWVETSESPMAWVDSLQPHLDANDRLFVVPVRPNDYQGLLTHEDWKWLEARL